MSAYIVDDATIHKVLTHLNSTRESWERQPFEQLGYNPASDDDMDRLAADLHILNCDAIDNRYSKGTAASDTAGKTLPCWKHVPAKRIAVYKAAQCLRYQCAEGDNTERPLFIALDEFIDRLASSIINHMPEYQEAKWG